MVFKNIEEIMEYTRARKKTRTVAVAAAADKHTLQAVMQATKEGFVTPLLVGDKKEIMKLLKEIGEQVDESAIYDAVDVNEIASQAVKLVREKKADFLMKGLLNTSDLLRAVLNKQEGLKHEGLVTVMAITELPGYHKLLTLNDCAVIPYPTLEQKKRQIQMVTEVLHQLGYGKDVKVAAICANEMVNPKMQESVEAAKLKEMNESGIISDCIVEGPISIDISLRPDVAQGKGFDSPVAGDADVLLFPTLVAGNCYAKAIEMGGAKPISFVLGTEVPIALTSRTTTVENKFNTLAMASAMVKEV